MSNEWGVKAFLTEHPVSVKVEIVSTRGSTPREAGAWMLVAPDAIWRTIGGGRLEYMAMEKARELIREHRACGVMDLPLGPEIGQCCGGRVTIQLDLLDPDHTEAVIRREATERAAMPHVYIFGAGHVGNALAEAMQRLPVQLVIADPREEELRKVRPEIASRLTPVPEQLIREAPPGSAFVVLTHDHALDFLLAAEALNREDAAYAGMIGSRTKRATFQSWYLKNGGNRERLQRLVSPIGGNLPDKRPEVIACFAAAEMMQAILTYASSVNAAASAFSAD